MSKSMIVCEKALPECGDCGHGKPHKFVATCSGSLCVIVAEKFITDNPKCTECVLNNECDQWNNIQERNEPEIVHKIVWENPAMNKCYHARNLNRHARCVPVVIGS